MNLIPKLYEMTELFYLVKDFQLYSLLFLLTLT